MELNILFILKLNEIDPKSLWDTIPFCALRIEWKQSSCPNCSLPAELSRIQANRVRIDGTCESSDWGRWNYDIGSEGKFNVGQKGIIQICSIRRWQKRIQARNLSHQARLSLEYYLVCSNKWPQMRVILSRDDRAIDCWASGNKMSLLDTVKHSSLMKNVLGFGTHVIIWFYKKVWERR